MSLVEFLRARLDEDEAAAKAWLPFGNPDDAARAHIARHDPARVLAEVEAKRRIIDLHGAEPHECVAWDGDLGLPCTCYEVDCPTLLLLALLYASHPDYDEAWRT